MLHYIIFMARDLDPLLKEIDKIMDDFVDSVFAKSQQNLVDDNKIDTGTLFKTGNIVRKFLDKEIVYPASYATDVEYGRMAGTMPPIDSLTKWVERKLRVPKNESRSVAFAIAKSIKERGIEQTPFLRNALEQTQLEFKNLKFK